MFGKQIHRYIFLFATILIIVSLPFSKFFLSVGQIVLASNWLVEGGFKRKLTLIKERPAVLFFLSIFIIHLLGLINTINFDYAFYDLQKKLPLFALPLIFGTTNPLNKKEFSLVIHFYITAILVATIISLSLYIGVGDITVVNKLDLSLFISHIRFALMVVLAFYIVVGILLINKELRVVNTYLYLFFALWLLLFIVFLSTYTGIVLLIMVFPLAFIFWIKKSKTAKSRQVSYTIFTLTSLLIALYFGYSIYRFSDKKEVDLTTLPSHTVNGNTYLHDTTNLEYENGNLTWIFLCDKELREQWSARSNLDFNGGDLKGQRLRITLIRYLTSLGYKKDSVGVSKLSDEDIALIENGIGNYIMKKKWSVYSRFYEILWEINHYIKTGDPNGHSIVQRFEYAKNTIRVAKRFFWQGTGTGDINDEIQKQYKIDNSRLNKNLRLRTHNQYLTFFATFGLFNFCLMVFFIVAGVYKQRANIDFIFFTFILISLFSMLSEDTIESHVGISFFAFFFSLLLLGREIKTENN